MRSQVGAGGRDSGNECVVEDCERYLCCHDLLLLVFVGWLLLELERKLHLCEISRITGEKILAEVFWD